MLTLYLSPGSSSMAPHIALHEVGAIFETRVVSLAKKENRAPAYLALNPEGKVPLLLVDGRPLTEVAAILFYLARRHPEAGLWPAGDLDAEARVVSWMSFIAATIHPARRQGPEQARAVFRLAEDRLAGHADDPRGANGEWAIGRYSIADIHLFRLYWRFRPTFGFTPADSPRLSDHYDHMMARPAVARTCAIEAAIGYELPA